MSNKRKDSKGRVLRNGEVQRPDGKYMYRYTDSSGKRQTVYSWKLVSTDKVPEGKRCTTALRDLEKQIQKDLDDDIRTRDADGTTVNDLFSSFMEIRFDLKETTRCNYIVLYDTHVRDTLGSRRIKAVKYTDIQKVYSNMVQEKNLKIATVQGVHAILYQIFDRAVFDNLLRQNPCANALKDFRRLCDEEQKKRRALTEVEQARLVDYIYGSTAYKKWGSLFTVLLGTGMRIGEALGLRWCDCDFDKGLISVNHTILYKERESGGYEYRISTPKTVAGNRVIPMFPEVRAALKQEFERPRNPSIEQFVVDGYSGFIFTNKNGKVFTPAYVFDVIQDITYSYNREEYFLAEKEGREPCYLPKFSAHILRHTFCTRLCEHEPNIKVVQDIMGHRNIRTTMDVYNEATEAKKQASFKNLEGKIKLA